MTEYKIGNVYRRKGFHYKVLDERPLDDTFMQYLLVASFCSDCGELYQFDIPSWYLEMRPRLAYVVAGCHLFMLFRLMS